MLNPDMETITTRWADTEICCNPIPRCGKPGGA
jgi:hypothetical protein